MLKVENLYYNYEDGTKALKDINLDTDKGKIIGIIGSNGSGKSTLLLNIMGILKPSKGLIKYDGTTIKYNKSYLREYRKHVNIVFQNPDQQIFYSNVFDDLAFPLRNLGINENIISKKVFKALEQVEGLDLIDKPVHFLSYGQKKRIAIAGVLVMESTILLLDEPTAGLDPHMTKQMKNIINQISLEKNIIISSHDMDLIYDICDYIYILSNGRIIGEGKPEKIFREQKLIEEAHLVKPWLVRIHEKFNVPLFKREEDFINYNGGRVCEKGNNSG